MCNFQFMEGLSPMKKQHCMYSIMTGVILFFAFGITGLVTRAVAQIPPGNPIVFGNMRDYIRRRLDLCIKEGSNFKHLI